MPSGPYLKCLVVMPFASDLSDVYRAIQAAVENAAGELSVACRRLDEVTSPGRISEELVEALEVADFCVADLTGNNPNVMWEVGYAMALERPLVFVCQNVDALPFDLKMMRTLQYDRKNLAATLQTPLAEAVSSVIHSTERLFASWKRERIVRARGSATPLRIISRHGKVKSVDLEAWTQDFDDVELRLRESDVRLSAEYVMRHDGQVRVRGHLTGSGPLINGRGYLGYRIEDRERRQSLNGVLQLLIPQWGDITGYYLAESYSRSGGIVLGQVSLSRSG